MYPLLLSIGPLHLYSFSVFLIVAWCVWSFVFWKSLRSQGVDEDIIFDSTFYATFMALVGARLWFVALHYDLFADNFLKVAAIWVQPGLSFYGGLVAGMLTLVFLTRRTKARVGYVLDAVGLALPPAIMVGLVGTFLDGSTIGTPVNLPWAVRYVGHTARRHPIQLYELLAVVVLLIVLLVLQHHSIKRKWPYGVLGVFFFLLFAPVMFMLEFVRDGGVYWKSVSANQWILVALFCEAVGAFYVRGGGRETLRPLWRTARTNIQTKLGGWYDKFTRRHRTQT